MMLNSVDFPQPDGPITDRNSPGTTLNETWSTAVRTPSCVSKRLTMSSTTRIGSTAIVTLTGEPGTRSRSAAVGLASGHFLRAGRRIARDDPGIDHGHAAAFDHLYRLLQGLLQLAGVVARTKSLRAQRLADAGNVDIRVTDALADPLVVHRAAAGNGHPLLVDLVVIERAIIGHDHQQGNAVVHRSPERVAAHHEVAVAANRDRHAIRAFQRQGCADRDARSATDAAAAVRADVVER